MRIDFHVKLQPPMRVLYYVSDTNIPSWGVGMIYTHVRMLSANGIDAAVLHEKRGFRPDWMGFDAPRLYRNDKIFRAADDDLVVVPEVHAADPEALNLSRRRIVFVQASSYIEAGFGKTRNSDRNYARLGYAGAMTTMPHIRRIVERHYGIAAPVVPPCIAPWFFGSADGPRRKQVVFCPKPWCQDYPIVRPMLVARARALGWSVLELTDRPHKQVARAFQRAAIHVNVNCHESFNATVPEAMAAGCIAICYEAFGGRDFLRNGKNAYVFPTHHAYPLVEHTLELMASWDARTAETDKVRKHAATTAARYTEAVTERALLRYFRRLSDAA
jgi:hypothetical protein